MAASSDIQLSVPASHGLGDDTPTATIVDADKSGAPLSCSETRALRKRVHRYISRHSDRFHSSFPFLYATHSIYMPNTTSPPEGNESDTQNQDGVRIFIKHTFAETKGHSWLISSTKDTLASLWADPRLLGTPLSSGIDYKDHKKLVACALMKSLKHGRPVVIASRESWPIHSVAQGNSERETWQCAWCRRDLSSAVRPRHALGIKKCFECCNG